jgi:hypothetical protein
VSTARCNWHIGDLGLPDDTDPLQEISHLQSTAAVIDLSVDEADLLAMLDRLIDREGRYFMYAKADDGVSPLQCELKWEPQHVLTRANGSLNCFNCPHYEDNLDKAMSRICALGREQQNITEQIRGLRIADSLEMELVAAYARDIEQSAELAEYVLAAA